MKITIVLLLFAVIASLFSGLYFVGADKGATHRAVIALTARIGLSVLVFGLLLLSHFMGWTTGGRL
ncbi:MAG: twin transmembrane helix small protein [Usitatibacter sp.]